MVKRYAIRNQKSALLGALRIKMMMSSGDAL